MSEEPVALERASVRGIWAALRWFYVRPGHLCSLPPLLAGKDVKLYGFTWTHVLLDLLCADKGLCCKIVLSFERHKVFS